MRRHRKEQRIKELIKEAIEAKKSGAKKPAAPAAKKSAEDKPKKAAAPRTRKKKDDEAPASE